MSHTGTTVPDPTRDFPVMHARWLQAVPWAFVAPHARQAQANHSQTLVRLAQRQGLDPTELLAVVEDRPWHNITLYAAEYALVLHLARWLEENR